MDKKEIEKKVLDLVYKEVEYAEILESEEPDFRIRHRGETGYFGVEITTFHYTESYARLRAIPDYFEEIIGQAKYRHKDDKQELEALDVVIYDAEGNEKSKTKCLLRHRPKIEDHIAMVAAVISRKEVKLAQYQDNLTHINLIIFDAESGFSTLPKDAYYENLFTQELRALLYKSRFHEIFLVTVLANRWVYIPLKMNLLVGEWYLFHKFLLKFYPDRVIKSWNDFQIFFAQYMQYKTGNVFYIRHKHGQIEVIWANTGVVLSKPNNSILNHADYPLSPKVIKPTLKGVTRFFKSKEFQANLSELYRSHTFSTQITPDVNGPVDFLRGRMKTFFASEVPKG